MKARKPIALIPGGFEEATLSHRLRHRVYLKNRVGFVKYALENGYALQPVYCFGENSTYDNVQGAWEFRFWLNGLGIPTIVPRGKWWFPLLPQSEKMHIVVGRPLKLPKIPKPTPEQVSEHHAAYVERLRALFDCHKATFGEGGSELEVW